MDMEKIQREKQANRLFNGMLFRLMVFCFGGWLTSIGIVWPGIIIMVLCAMGVVVGVMRLAGR